MSDKNVAKRSELSEKNLPLAGYRWQLTNKTQSTFKPWQKKINHGLTKKNKKTYIYKTNAAEGASKTRWRGLTEYKL